MTRGLETVGTVGLETAGLETVALTVRFGGLVAVDGVSLHAPMGRITALIGPNGAGKTTTFNACTGLVRPTAGTVRLAGEDVTALAPHARAQRGLGRTFQRIELFDSLTVRENVALGREAVLAGSRPLRQLTRRPGERQTVAAAVDEAFERCGLGPICDRRAGTLSTGQRRLVELARVIAGDFRFLLLDEPSSGLDSEETERFGSVLGALVGDRATGILLVEHDIALVMRVSAYLYVLDFGKLIFEGSPAAVAASPLVRAAYLGSSAEELVGVLDV
ncbi:MAG TPA: ABC transporter ATP-binding protein [Acidimicrobiia bacterium]|nr:ABC transporter ATP-binding protein [Acidimicrobiia bacterium]